MRVNTLGQPQANLTVGQENPGAGANVIVNPNVNIWEPRDRRAGLVMMGSTRMSVEKGLAAGKEGGDGVEIVIKTGEKRELPIRKPNIALEKEPKKMGGKQGGDASGGRTPRLRESVRIDNLGAVDSGVCA